MKAPPEIKIIPAFAVPFGASYLDDPELNKELKALFLSRETSEFENKNRNSEESDLVFESNFDLFTWTDKCVVKLKEYMTACVIETIGMVNQYKRSTVAEFDIYADAWYHITRKGGNFTNHNHPMASWSAVYCIADGIDDADTESSGVTRFFHPQTAASTYLDAGNINMTHDHFSFGHKNFKLKSGQIVIFPSWIYHDVSTYTGNSERIVVAVNYWFKHPDMNPQIGPLIYKGKNS
jgi:uncharacterized protein (TIGR02466 family)